MKKIIRLTEADLHRIIRESVEDILKKANSVNLLSLTEDAGGATNAAGVMQTGVGSAPTGSNPEAGQYTVPFGKVQRRKGYNPKGDAKGDVTKQSSNVDMSPALDRKGGKNKSIAMNHV